MTERRKPGEPFGGPDEGVSVDAVPAAFSAVKPKKPVDYRDPKSFESMKGHEVIVEANGVEYRGKLLGADDAELYLRSELRHVSVMLERVRSVRRTDEKPPPLATGVVDQAFYGDENDPKK